MIWTIHAPDDLRDTDALEAVPERTSIWALLFPPFWLAAKGLWLAFGAYLAIIISLFALLATPYFAVPLALGGLPGLWVWLEGSAMRRANLERQGLVMRSVIEAPDARTALARHIARLDFTPPARVPLPDRPARVPSGKPTESFGFLGS